MIVLLMGIVDKALSLTLGDALVIDEAEDRKRVDEAVRYMLEKDNLYSNERTARLISTPSTGGTNGGRR